MARQIVTQQAVTDAAEALIVEGAEPSIVAVQARIGGGSYSTVKKFLDVWKQQRAEAATAAPETPAEVQAKGQEFARIVWALASREAQAEAQQAKDEAQAAVAAVRVELAEATNEIARLEGVEAAQAATIDQQAAKLREVELALAEAQTQARRVAELEKSLADLRAELDASRKDATDKAVEAGRLAGEGEALRAQVRELMDAIKPQAKK
ncbi:DNA-binding protein [Craterilacuibacter sp. RT1T]|jgi:chromosome segregation ATPase|uniref:DNA-binding protein n=1 Tax=Craterilacuibacter sp. RT1T TaxID=2942211 RepID=UPI0020C15AF9|nr:DNA-binding protein [Craterilacuibacter sp. RT1T]MCL6264785.1 DNA-binding protein [Craterilacuibacter sp. RT1T]